MIDAKALLADLRGQVKALEADLRLYGVTNGTTAAELEREWQAARDAQRTAATYEMWREDRVTQVAVAWVLGTVFVRFCEDNDLIEYPVIAGPGDRVAVARERQGKFFEESPELTDRDWIVEGFNALSVSPVAAGLFEEHNPMWSIFPSHEAAKALLAFWREQDANAQIVHDFTDETWNTRFLGDLYQDLSEHAKKTYALLQTPVFIEEFILKYTLDPAIKEFGLEPEPPYGHGDLPRRLRVIDPACGSGHFLLGAFHRLLQAWEDRSGDADKWVLIARILESVHGVDKNPFAAAIARFRLMLVAMRAGEIKRLTAKVDFPINVAVGDSLIHGRGGAGIQTELALYGEHHTYTYRTEDIDEYINSVDILGVGSYHVVVGNPPYITINDKRENAAYRRSYPSCHREYSLAVPFAERLFQLAIRGGQDDSGAGFVGQITANSFMKREFGSKLIEEFFPTIDLTYVIDVSGARLPGFGTPPVILIGRRRWPRENSTVRVVMRISGEPGLPQDPAMGLVWRSIVELVDRPGSANNWISIADLQRERLAKHPWSLSGGGAAELRKTIEDSAASILKDHVEELGYGVISGEDDAFFFPSSRAISRFKIEAGRHIVTGDTVRDYCLRAGAVGIWPYDERFYVRPPYDIPEALKLMWPQRRILQRRKRFGVPVEEIKSFKWYEYRELYAAKLQASLSVTFAEIVTHNHFVFSKEPIVANQTAPLITLSKSGTEDEYLELVGILNSSTACFWLKQVCYVKGGSGIGRGVQDEPWEERYSFNVTRVKQFPLPAELPLTAGRELDELGRELTAVEPRAVCVVDVPTRDRLDEAHTAYNYILGRMIALQEELDWDVYQRYGLLADDEAEELIAEPEVIPELQLGERAFEIALARRIKAGEINTQWFARHESKPIYEMPAHWPSDYQTVVAKRLQVIERRPGIGLLERPEYKRRWQSDSWEAKEQTALRNWLLDRCEDPVLWLTISQQPQPMTLNRLADKMRGQKDVVTVSRLLNGPDADLSDVLTEIIADQHVPYLTQLRYKGEGLLKRALWENSWDLQREEDRTGQR